MDISQNIFRRKKVNFEKLTAFGFSKKEGTYSYRAVLSESGFVLTVHITERGEIGTSVTDPASGEPYVLHLADHTEGRFVGGVKAEYEQVLSDIAAQCFERDVFKSDLTKTLIRHIRDTYGDELEYLWEKFPECAVARRKDNRKWYAVFLTVSRRKLGFDSDETVEVLDLRMTPEETVRNVDGVKLLPGYHMNKKHWISVCLDGIVPPDEICGLLDESYRLAHK